MSFLQPWMLAALPLALIPVIIHLINQRRYQTTPWAAMMFLLAANRLNRGYARIRQWAILALRMLVIAALVIAIGRPLASGLLGSGLAGSITGRGSGEILVLLDRSPSMQARGSGSSASKLETAVTQIAQTLDTMGVQRLVLIESNSNQPRELESPAALLDLPQTAPSDASADLPAMLLAAQDYITTNQLGKTEIWIGSDLRRHDWRSEDGRWATLRDAFVDLGRRVRFRLLAFPDPAPENLSVRVGEARLESDDQDATVVLSLTVRSAADASESDASADSSRSVPVTIDLAGARSTVDVELNQGIGELTGYRVPAPEGQSRGYGSVSIPADVDPADNTFFFTFDDAPLRRSVIVSDDAEVSNVLKLASEIVPQENVQSEVEVISPRAVDAIPWDDLALVLWHAPLPAEDESPTSTYRLMQSFVDRGGQVIFFPPLDMPGPSQSTSMFSMRWGSWQTLPEEDNAVNSWRGDADLLAATLAGAALPVGQLRVSRYAALEGDATELAKLGNGAPLLARVPTPTGGAYFCCTTPRAADSSLAADGVVLYVMIQRALAAGAASLQNTRQLDAGQASADAAAQWKRILGESSGLSTEQAFLAGVYEQPTERRWVAVNRSDEEDDGAVLSDANTEELFRGLILDRVDQQAGGLQSLVEEIWRAFLIVMLLAMIGEALLCLPRARTAQPAMPFGNTLPRDSVGGGAAA
ncbi:hypothetical protein FYK55_20600 [Roseiconus nitratireducens]|uniref:Aerotolerance regulator N-terminal domain-containing protein n=1 Tax=Roseiconus nitratireducens TaxID=2605748 RepID=A0A5M6CYW0_9BACT|nr:BatA domain-containing protein [Roseiconus nitratireducens]KAA5540417.1 hypothetical protein FYK55_20600 [Roseiconus nitratireducens]